MFINDFDKINDIFILSKEEFLKSYSYLTEQEYDDTVFKIKELILNNRLESRLG